MPAMNPSMGQPMDVTSEIAPSKQMSFTMQFVGPILARDPEPLPQELSSILEQGLAAGNAAVYVSMGTLGVLSEAEMRSMAKGLSALPNPVLWKMNSLDLPGMHASYASVLDRLRCSLNDRRASDRII